MTRTRNASFGGMAPPDADVDVPTFRTRFLELVQDVHFLIDKMTGANGISSTAVCNHNGELGRGAPLRRVPIAQSLQTQGWDSGGLSSVGTPILGMDEADVATYGGRLIILAVPFVVVEGEELYTVEVRIDDRDDDLTFELYDSSMALDQTIEAARNGSVFAAPIQTPTPGDYFLVVRARVDDASAGRMRDWCVYPPQVRLAAAPQPVSDGANYFPVGTATAELPETIHDEMVVDNYPVAGWLITTLSRNINWLLEAARGAPLQGNGALNLADSAALNPATSAFWAHSQDGTTFASEAEVEYVLFGEALGAVQGTALDASGVTEVVDSGMTQGLLDWAPLIPTFGGTTRRTGHKRACYVPNFQAGTSRLKARCLMANSNGKGTPTAWDFRVTTAAGSSAAVAFTQLGTSQFYVSEVVAIPFSPDAINVFELELARSAGVTTMGEIQVVGWEVFFQP